MMLHSKQLIGTERFTEVVETTEFQKVRFLNLRQQRGHLDEHVPPLRSQVFVATQSFRRGTRVVAKPKRNVQSDSADERSQKASKPSGLDEKRKRGTNDVTSTPNVPTEPPETRDQKPRNFSAPSTTVTDLR